MRKYMRADVNFGLPMVTYVLPLGTEGSQRLQAALSSLDARAVHDGDQDALDLVYRAVERAVLQARPHLEDGLVVVSYELDCLLRAWRILVMHPSLPRVESGYVTAAVLLTPCPMCGKDIGAKEWQWLTTSGGVVCSQECLHAAQTKGPPPGYRGPGKAASESLSGAMTKTMTIPEADTLLARVKDDLRFQKKLRDMLDPGPTGLLANTPPEELPDNCPAVGEMPTASPFPKASSLWDVFSGEYKKAVEALDRAHQPDNPFYKE
jgi:hypothetical protein